MSVRTLALALALGFGLSGVSAARQSAPARRVAVKKQRKVNRKRPKARKVKRPKTHRPHTA